MRGRTRNDVLPVVAQPADDGSGLTDGQLLRRFVEGRDEIAFAVLVRRHGPMVLGVCRRMLRHDTDADDAFQATFLVMVRRAGSVRPEQGVGGWLYGVARRTALKARALAARRRAHERPQTEFAEPAAPAPGDDNLRPMIDHALSRMPERYRVPIVLCDLEGKPQKEAARELGCPEGTLSGRLTRARRMLAARLARSPGPAVLSGASIATLLGVEVTSATMPGALVNSPVRVACTAGLQRAAGAAPSGANQLAEGVVREMLLTKWKTSALVMLTALLVVAGAGSWLFRTGAAPVPKEERPAASITMRSYPFDDTAEILRITRRSGQVTLGSNRPPAGRLVIEFYFNGQKQNRTIEAGGFDHTAVKSAWGKPVEFCIQAADLDYLPLADPKKGHCRVLIKTGIDGSFSSSTRDIEKEFFDFAQGGGAGPFTAEISSGDTIPLFYTLIETNEMRGANTVEDLIRLNPKGKLAIVYLRLHQ